MTGPEFTNTMINAAAMDVQADWVYTILSSPLQFDRAIVELAAEYWVFSASLSPAYTGTGVLGYFV